MSLESSFSQKLTVSTTCAPAKGDSSSAASTTAPATSAQLKAPSSPQPKRPTSATSSASSSSSSAQPQPSSQAFTSRSQSFKTFGNTNRTYSKDLSRDDSPSKSPSHRNRGNHAGGSVDRTHSVRVTRKIFHNWRSACGKTKDSFIRRWKTLPENHPDFESIGEGDPVTGINIPTASSSHAAAAAAAAGDSASGSHASSSGASGGGFGNKIKNLAKKASDNDVLGTLHRAASVCKDDDSAGTVKPEKKAWTVHVWATYVQRGSLDEETLNDEEPPLGRTHLSDFQKVKLTHFFRHVLDMNRDDVISAADFVALNQRIRHYIEWSCECIEFHILKEVHSGFLECFLNQPLDDCSHMYYSSKDKETRDHVNVDEWLDVWGELLRGARSLESLPLWLQYFPKILFQVINKSGSGTISREELRAFYTMFLGIDFRVVNDTLESIYNAMTDKGRNKINYGLFKLCFTNFLLAKHPHGPGQYLFGICSPQTLVCAFPIDYSALNTPPSDLEPYDPQKEKQNSNRRSVIV